MGSLSESLHLSQSPSLPLPPSLSLPPSLPPSLSEALSLALSLSPSHFLSRSRWPSLSLSHAPDSPRQVHLHPRDEDGRELLPQLPAERPLRRPGEMRGPGHARLLLLPQARLGAVPQRPTRGYAAARAGRGGRRRGGRGGGGDCSSESSTSLRRADEGGRPCKGLGWCCPDNDI